MVVYIFSLSTFLPPLVKIPKEDILFY